MKKNTTMQAGQLYALIPHCVAQHFADQKKVNAFDVCEMMVQQHPSWVNRLFDNETSYCLNDLTHDFVGLAANDEHFVPRI
tara:strand:- start:525 stop:767 length:243 start_codon:yes stop_codon:yes gene_type:complete